MKHLTMFAFVAAIVTALNPALAQSQFDRDVLVPLTLGSHPSGPKVDGVIARDLLDRSEKQRHLLFVADDSKESRERFAKILQTHYSPAAKSNLDERVSLSVVFVPEMLLEATYPPAGKAPYYTGPHVGEQILWRSLGWLAPDLIVCVDESPGEAHLNLPEGLPEKLSRALHDPDVPIDVSAKDGLTQTLTTAEPAARLGHIPAIDLVCPDDKTIARVNDITTHLAGGDRLPRSPAFQELLDRRARSPIEIAKQLDVVYGHHLKTVMYQPALSLVARLKLDDLLGETTRTADVEKIVAQYAAGKKPTLGKKPSGSVTAGHLIFSELAHRVDKQKYLPLVLAAANQGFGADGKPLPAMPAHSEMSDAVFMGGPILAAAGRLTGDEKYYDLCLQHERFMQKLCWRADGIYRHSPLCEAAWGRGNGFPALGLAWVLSEIPADHPAHRALRKDFQRHLTAMLEHQDPTGMWHQVVDEPGTYREMTVTCMTTFAIIRGLRNGWLDAETFAPAVKRAWPAVAERIAPNGVLLDVCTGTGKQKTLQAYYERPAILGTDERGGAMAFLVVTEYAQW